MKLITDVSVMSRPMVAGRGLTPASLFNAGGTGAWFDPSDSSTLFVDVEGTQSALEGDAIARIANKTGSAIPALQPAPLARPKLGRVPVSGRRNILSDSEDASSYRWAPEGVIIAQPDETFPKPLSGPQAIWSVTETNADTPHRVRATQLSVVAGLTYTASIYAKAGTADRLHVVFFSSGNAWTGGASFDLTHGTLLSGGVNATISDAGNGWYRCAIKTLAGGTNTFGQIIWGLSSVGAYPGNTGNTVYLTGRMLEIAPHMTPYQLVTSAFDVSEAGQASTSYLAADQNDSSVTWTAPDGVYTVAYAGSGGAVVISDGQTLSGPTEVMQTTPIAEYVAINRALTQLERNSLAAYLEHKGAGL